MRGSIALGERISPKELADLNNEFSDASTRTIIRHGIIDKFIGDEVMALYPPPPSGGRVADALVDDAVTILRSLGYPDDPILTVGVGIGIGEAYVGHVGTDAVSGFTAIGDIVNTVARFQSSAKGGEVVMPTSLAELATFDGRLESLTAKGKAEPISVCIAIA